MAREHFQKPNTFERLINKTVGVLARWGLGPSYIHILEVRGRSSGNMYSTPVNVLEMGERCYLVGGRGHTAWSKNASVVGRVTLRRGSKVQEYRAVPLSNDQKPAVLKAYLEAYPGTVQRFFSVQAGSPVEAFRAIVDQHPVFEVMRQH